MQQWCAQISTWLWQWMAPSEDHQLAPFATRIYALDESTMRAIKRWLKEVRDVPIGDPSLVAGGLIGLFDIRPPQGGRIGWLPQAMADCQVHGRGSLNPIGM